MVCPRCIEAVEEGLRKNDMQWSSVELGRVMLTKAPDEKQLNDFSEYISGRGFELIQQNKNALVSDIKSALILYLEGVESGGETGNISDCLSKRLHKNYSYLSDLFSETTGQTIERYYIKLRAERAKELLQADKMQIGEIALTLGFSSSQHFSAQFKKVTGQSPGTWKKSHQSRKGLVGL